MNGKEALERIKKLSCVWDVDKDEFKDAIEITPNAFKTIEKDLEVLEIIKKHISFMVSELASGKEILNKEYYLSCKTPMTETEFNLIKEWLNNGD